jgi:hypothetical protein
MQKSFELQVDGNRKLAISLDNQDLTMLLFSPKETVQNFAQQLLTKYYFDYNQQRYNASNYEKVWFISLSGFDLLEKVAVAKFLKEINTQLIYQDCLQVLANETNMLGDYLLLEQLPKLLFVKLRILYTLQKRRKFVWIDNVFGDLVIAEKLALKQFILELQNKYTMIFIICETIKQNGKFADNLVIYQQQFFYQIKEVTKK